MRHAVGWGALSHGIFRFMQISHDNTGFLSITLMNVILGQALDDMLTALNIAVTM